MCLGVPGRIIETSVDSSGTKMARVSFSGVVRDVCLAYEPDADVGEYVIVHVGYATSRLDEADANQILQVLHQMEKPA